MKDELLERHEEELEDANRYDEMAKQYPEFCQIFHDIANEERVHAKMIKYVIEHM